MATAAELSIEINASTEKARAEMNKLGTAGQGVMMALGPLAAALAGVFAAGKIIDGMKASVLAASDLAETMNKVDAVFKDSAGSVQDWSETSVSAMFMTQEAALAAASGFGNLLTSMGFMPEVAAEMSTNMTDLAADFASFNNIGTEEAIDAIRSAMVGETEAIRRLGVNMNEAELQAAAFNLGLIEQGDKLSAAQKAAAAYTLIVEQSKNAQGDAAKTADSLANRLKALRADIGNAAAEFGERLLPAVNAAVGWFTSLIPTAVDFLVGVFDGFANAVSGVFDFFRSLLGDNLKVVANWIKSYAIFLKANAKVWWSVFKAIVRLVWESFKLVVGAVASGLSTILGDSFKGTEGTRKNFENAFVQIVNGVADAMLKLALLVQKGLNKINTMFADHPLFKLLPEGIKNAILSFGRGAVDVLHDLSSELRRAAEEARQAFASIGEDTGAAFGEGFKAGAEVDFSIDDFGDLPQALDLGKAKKVKKAREKRIREAKQATIDQAALAARLLREQQAAIKEAQAEAEADAKRLHDLVMGYIEDLERAEADLHAANMAGIQAVEDAETRRHEAAMADLADQRRAIELFLDDWGERIDDMKLALEGLELDLDIPAEMAALKGLTEEMKALKGVIGSLEVFSSEQTAAERKRIQQAAKERIKLTTDAQRAALEGARGLFSGEQLALVERLLAGYSARASEVREIFARVEEEMAKQVEDQKDIIDAKKAQIEQAKREIAHEEHLLNLAKDRAEETLKGIAQREAKERDRHENELRRIEGLRGAEQARHDAEVKRLADMTRREAERHARNMARIAEEFAMRLLLLEHTEEEVAALLAEVAQKAAAIAAEAASIFEDLVANVRDAAIEAVGAVERVGKSAVAGLERVVEAVRHEMEEPIMIPIAPVLKLGAGGAGGDSGFDKDFARSMFFSGKRGSGGFRAGATEQKWREWHEGIKRGVSGRENFGPFDLLVQQARAAFKAIEVALLQPLREALLPGTGGGIPIPGQPGAGILGPGLATTGFGGLLGPGLATTGQPVPVEVEAMEITGSLRVTEPTVHKIEIGQRTIEEIATEVIRMMNLSATTQAPGTTP